MAFQREIRDPIHNFIRLDSVEVKVLDSAPFQRLRHIHQLALTYLLYPGATHRRFEHSLGVMEFASRVYDIVTKTSNIHDAVKDIIQHDDLDKLYWRRTLRMAALCHDLGHLPFSHAAEKDLLPKGWDHERLSFEFIKSDEMEPIWDEMKIISEDVAKLAIGPEHYKETFSDWEAILSEIIVGDAFGVDRIDYLLRDSYHVGVAYGRFDQHRLIDTLRILPKAERSFKDEIGSQEPVLGIEEGGLRSAEALLLARYFMYSDVYCHHVRRIHDIHLKDFLKEWLPKGIFSTEVTDLLQMTDNEVMSELLKAARDKTHNAHDHARRIVDRDHFRLLYQRNPLDQKINIESCNIIYEAACDEFGESEVRKDSYRQKSGSLDFPVVSRDQRIISSHSMSDTLARVPIVAIDVVYINPDRRVDAENWLNTNRKRIISSIEEAE